MTEVFLDSSVILRVVLDDPRQLEEFESIARPVISAIGIVECFRSIDRIRHTANLPDELVASTRDAVYSLIEYAAIVDVTQPILSRASMPLPTALKTLDAIHLATAQIRREQTGEELIFATHDIRQGVAAQAVGFATIGL